MIQRRFALFFIPRILILFICVNISLPTPSLFCSQTSPELLSAQHEMQAALSVDQFAANEARAAALIDNKNGIAVALGDPEYVTKKNSSYEARIFFDESSRIKKLEYYDLVTHLLYQVDYYTENTSILSQVEGYSSYSTVETRALYNSLGIKTHEIHFNLDYTTSSISYFDQTNGKKFSQEFYFSTGTVRARTLFDAEGKKISERTFYANGELESECEFDSAGKTLRKLVYQNGQLQEEQLFSYLVNPDGEWKFIETRDGAGKTLRQENYDGSGKKYAEELWDPASGVRLSQKWFYTTTANEQVYRWITYTASGKIDRLKEYQADGTLVRDVDASFLTDSESIEAGILANQAGSDAGLVASYPDETGFIYHEGMVGEGTKIYANTQAYTYDQALAGIAMLKSGNEANAKKIFDYFYAQRTKETSTGAAFSGFWTVYNIQKDFDWKKYEWRKGMGENLWLGLFCMHYYNAATDATEKEKALSLAVQVAKWVASLPHTEGAVAMGPANNGWPNWGVIYSTENNIDYYAVLKDLLTLPINDSDRALFTAELAAEKNWLLTKAYDPAKGFFKRGGQSSAQSGTINWDNTAALDVNSWGATVLGFDVLVNELGISLPDFSQSIETEFAVQTDGAFGGPVFNAMGFDFSDEVNAGLVNRRGIEWVEGTNQMILLYKKLADYYRSLDPLRARYYESLAGYFTIRNYEDAQFTNGQTAFRYSDLPRTQIFYGTTTWSTASGRSTTAAAWAYFALNKIDPFAIL